MTAGSIRPGSRASSGEEDGTDESLLPGSQPGKSVAPGHGVDLYLSAVTTSIFDHRCNIGANKNRRGNTDPALLGECLSEKMDAVESRIAGFSGGHGYD
jgi:hypothetical protein